ncbi:hypothetical protein [Rhodococcus zopfii]|uniref:hypothetical protein n=1 Tax=Rhodococcus zopfii TaxID=43772 RepID=UPI003528EB08
MITWNCQRCGDRRHGLCGKPLCGQGDDNLAEAISTDRRARGELTSHGTAGEQY